MRRAAVTNVGAPFHNFNVCSSCRPNMAKCVLQHPCFRVGLQEYVMCSYDLECGRYVYRRKSTRSLRRRLGHTTSANIVPQKPVVVRQPR